MCKIVICVIQFFFGVYYESRMEKKVLIKKSDIIRHFFFLQCLSGRNCDKRDSVKYIDFFKNGVLLTFLIIFPKYLENIG